MKAYKLDINGITYACLEKGEGPLILLMHGTCGGKQLMVPQMDALSSAFRCVAFDWPGHGESGFKPGGWTADDLVEDVSAIIAALGEESAILAGVSQGGAIAMRVALKYPKKARAIVNMCGGPGAPPPAVVAKLDAFTRLMAEGADDARRRAAADFATGYLHAPGFADREPRRFSDEVDVIMSHPRESMGLIFGVPISYVDITPRLGEIRCPTLIIWAPYDSRPGLGAELAAAIPGATLVIIPETGHHVNVDAPEATSAAIMDFATHLRPVARDPNRAAGQ